MPELAAFRNLYDFAFDDFQVEACRALESGHGVLLAAPTGSGKTVVGEFAVHLAIGQGRKCFYTTPIKALSNQKYSDLVRRYGVARVGLLTGDNSVNGEAPVVVMTTEVLRNMLYEGSGTLAGLSHVVLDEVHYLADRSRGAVWEEVIIHLPESVTLAALSATVSNAEEFGDWLSSVRGGTKVIVDEIRPVPLFQHMLVGGRLYDLFASGGRAGAARTSGPQVSPDLVRATSTTGTRPPGRARQRYPHFVVPRRPDVISRLDRAGLLPAITFIFSRSGCDAAVRHCLNADLQLTSPAEAKRIEAAVTERVAGIPAAELAVLGFPDWLAALRRGIAAHHAGLLPLFKEVTEDLFADGLVRAVFATETLAVGVNMPARTVVIDRMDKWNGDEHADLTAAEYTQLTGRAGRRGIDVEGHAVVLWRPGIDPAAVAGLAGTRTYPLNSSFRPSCNMAVNLVGQMGRERASRLLESSFAQFQADRAVVGLARRARKLREAAASLAVSCDQGDFAEYARLRAELSRMERETAKDRAAQRRTAVVASLASLRRGDVVLVPAGRRPGTAVVLEPATDPVVRPVVVLNEHRQVRRIVAADCPVPVSAIERIAIPSRFNPRSPQQRKDLAATMRNKLMGVDVRARRGDGRRGHEPEAGRAAIDALRRRLRQHPCHRCPDASEHARQAEEYIRQEREADALDRRIAGRAHVVARTFSQVCAVLAELGYVSADDAVTADGRMLGGLYCELDLLTAECIRREIWAELGPAELAACVSALTFEARGSEDGAATPLPRGQAGPVLAEMTRVWNDLDRVERGHGLDSGRRPDSGFARTAQAWAMGSPLADVLTGDLTAGDFVRAIKQVIDLLDQIREAAGARSALAQTAAEAVIALRRGVVAYSSIG